MIKLFNTATAVCCITLAGFALAPAARADDWNKKTVLTFSGPVEIPGVHVKGWGILPAGTYVFKIVDSQSDRHIVQVFSQDEKTIYATILAIPNYRLKATDKTVITFTERPAGQPEALRAWFYPGRTSGEEFVYPKSRAMELARDSNMPVLYTAAEIPLEVAETTQTPDAPYVAQLRDAPVMAVKPTGDDLQLAEVVTVPPAEPEIVASMPTTSAQTLPSTASPLGLMALLGMLALGGAMGLRVVEKRVGR